MQFAHLHVHTYYSILDGASSIESHFKKVQANEQPALAITDHGNMFGVKEFFKVAKKFPDIKPIVGCEVYVNPEGRFSKRGKEDQSANHLILLAKNLDGYYNLVKIVSTGWTEGFYYKPKIDHEILEKYHENIICSSACLGGEIPKFITDGNIEAAYDTARWYKKLFGDDYYLEVMLHKTELPGYNEQAYPLQQKVNAEIFKMSKELGIKVIATNDVHFTNKEDGPAHDRLICLTTNVNVDEPKRMKYTQQEYMKTTEEMLALFPDHPEVLENTMEIVDKIECYTIDKGHVLPIFPIPDKYSDSNDYLRDLVYEGAERHYKTIDDATRERIDFELATIKKMGFPDYFLIVQDFIKAARGMGVWVGPGRGSAAGSVVAYCLGITNLDPIKYDLLFERFLNPDRISMPDIDIDFDDEGRGTVLKYVEGKYGKDHVSHVVTFGTMATKSAIKDIARIQNVPLPESDRLTKLIPDSFPSTIVEKKDENGNVIGTDEKKNKVTVANCIKFVPEMREAYESSPIPGVRETLEYAQKLEGTVRNTGVHACAIIIGRDNLTKHIPICIAKDKETGEDMWVSQYEGSFIEDVGMLKMDFLGLRTLSILKEAVSNVKKHRGIDIDIEAIPIDDKATFDLFSRGDTVAVFQFESPGMQKWLRELQPNRFEDLIAMNALYRPGPMDYIPDFVARKKGEQKIEYDLPDMESILSNTYGITVYQEQVMLLSQKLANFTKGQADGLRKAMGKKLIDKMMELRTKFFDGGKANGHPKNILEKIWGDWTSFAQYAFNKSHATCYAWVAYQTGYMKANYPAEFMAANLSKNLNNMDEITKLMDECRRMGIAVLGPDVNESDLRFTVNKKGEIRFGMAGVKGVGANVVDSIVKGRESGPYKDIFDFIERASNAGPINRKTVEALVYAGAFDSFEGINRDQFFKLNGKEELFIDALCRYGVKLQTDAANMGNSLFGDVEEFKPVPPEIPIPGEYNKLEFLKKEKELVGMYLSAHPLDIFKFELKNFTSVSLTEAEQMTKDASVNAEFQNKELMLGGLITGVSKKVSQKNGKPWADFSIEDFNGSVNFRLFGKDYEAFLPFLEDGNAVFMKCKITPRFFAKKGEENRNKEGGDKPQQTDCELKIKRMILLANTKDDFIKTFTIDIPVNKLTESFRKSFVKELKKNKGHKMLSIKVLDFEKQIAADFFSKKLKIDVNNDLLDYLDHNNLDYSVEKEVNL